MLGQKPGEALCDVVLGNGTIKPLIKNQNYTDVQVLGFAELFLDMEIANWGRTCRAVTDLIQSLNGGTLGNVVGTDTKAPGTYGCVGTDSDARRAARWICGASLSVAAKLNAQINKVETLLNKYTQAGAASITNLGTLDKINKALMKGGGRNESRGPVMASPLPSSMGGRELLKNAMIFIQGRTLGAANCGYLGLGCYLLGIAIGCHGFPDANGRTGRFLYAVAQLKGINAGAAGVASPFRGLTVAGENKLHRLT